MSVKKEFVFIQMYLYESEEQVANMNKDLQEIAEIYTPVNVVNEYGVFPPKNSSSTRTSSRNRKYNILPNITEPVTHTYRINTVVVPYDTTNEDDIRNINLLIRKLGHTAEWFMIGDTEDIEKDYDILSDTLKQNIYPYQLWVWIKYIQDKRNLMSSVSSNSERKEVRRSIDSALQNIKDIYINPIYPRCIEEFQQLFRNKSEEEYVTMQTNLNDRLRICYKDFMLQVYIAIKAEGIGRTSEQITNMITEMYQGLGLASGEIMDIIQNRREAAESRRFQVPEYDPLIGGRSKRKTHRKANRTRRLRKSRRH